MSESFWKKEISFGRKPKKQEEAAATEVAPAVKAVLAPDAAPVAAPPASAAVPEAEPEPAAAPADLPSVKGDYGWLTTSFDPTDVPDEMPPIVPPLVSLPSLSAPLPAALGSDGPPGVAVPHLEEVAPAGTPEPAPEVVAPEPAAAATPFWKKELSFSRGPKPAKEPKAAKQPKQPKEPKQPKAAKQPKQPKAPKEAGVPFWKKELSFSRSAKESAPAVLAAGVAVPTPEVVAEKKPPLWKRELKLSKPSMARQPRTAKGEKQPKGEKTPKAARVPREKKAKGVGSQKTGLVGLKIGASQVAAARVSNANGTPQLLQVARAPLADGIVVGGELRDIEGLAQALKEMFAQHKLPKKGVRLGIANNRIGVRTFEIVGIDDPKQLTNAIRFRAQETLPIPLEEAVLDWQLLSESTDEETGQKSQRVMLVVAYRELVERYVLACKKAGISVAGIDLEAFAMLRALEAPTDPAAPAPTGAQVVVNVGHDRSTFAVSDGRTCEFTRVLGWGGQNLSVAIARALDLTPSQANPIKHALSLVAQAEPPEGISPQAMGAAREAVTNELQAFARELVSSLRFYQNQPGSLGIGQLVLTGGSAHLPGFAEELHRLIGVPVRVGDPLNRVVIPKKFREPEYAIGSLTVAIGLGIED